MNKEQTNYITADTRLPRYLPYPEFLLAMDLSQTAKVVYALLLNRTTLSQRSGWRDPDGNVFVIYPVETIADEMNASEMTVKRAMNELRAAGLIECRRKGYSAPYRIYVKLPPLVTKMLPHTEQNCYLTGNKSVPLSTKEKKYKTNNVVTGTRMLPFPIPDYNCEEGASL